MKLTSPFFRVERDNKLYFGGDQRWFASGRLRNCGCGYIACTNLLCHKEKRGKIEIEYMQYMRNANRLKWYMPVLPRLGMNGIFMAVGMNLFFLFNRKHYFCFWGMSRRKLNRRIEEMLREDIPVVLCIGQNFPNYWGKTKVKLYRKIENEYFSNSATNRHFVTITGMDDDWYQISSWGQELYINKIEFIEYVSLHSNAMASNILVVKKIGRGKL